ncbi:mfs transporter [Anaeramoeba ignava]|uniref:Mfs transporter n=1 Tax=Anaeramoeba ignava TaxID=1746090 RepID=A0A9Q0R6B9_ANAIG|nr:mfs transporter [Anaeramoeba ignava]
MSNPKIDTEEEIEINSVVIEENYKSNNNTSINLQNLRREQNSRVPIMNITSSVSNYNKSSTSQNPFQIQNQNLAGKSNGTSNQDEKKIQIQTQNSKENLNENSKENLNENSKENSKENPKEDSKENPEKNPKKDDSNDDNEEKGVEKVDKIAVLTIYFCLFIAIVAFSILIPIIPFYAYEHFQANALKVGVIEAAYSGTQFISSLFLGVLSDKSFGRKKLLLICLFGLMIGLFVTSFSKTLLQLILFRGLTGFFGGFISLTNAMITDVVPIQYRAKYLGFFGGIFGFALAIGPTIGSSVSKWQLKGACYISAILTFIGFVFAIFFLKETYVVKKSLKFKQIVAIAEDVPVEGLTTFKALVLLIKRPFLVRFQLSLFLSNLGFTGVLIIYPMLCAKLRFGLTESNIGYIYMMMGIVLLVIQGGAIGTLTKKIHLQTMVYIMVPFGGAMIFIVPEATTVKKDILMMFLVSISSAFRLPCIMSLISFTTKRTDRGTIMGLAQSLSALSRTIGPIVGGSIFDANYRLGFWIAGCLLIVSGLMMLGPKIPIRKQKQDEIEMSSIEIDDGTLPEFEKKKNYSENEWFVSSDYF